MKKTDKTTTLQELKELVAKFCDERNWSSQHTPKNLAVSIAIEAAELLEHYQWEVNNGEDKVGVTEELADILVYCLIFASVNTIDMSQIVRDKIAKIAKKYPADVVSGEKLGMKTYLDIKKSHRSMKKG
jgi:dCTP diphosphatase